jgi:hypothetical protein
MMREMRGHDGWGDENESTRGELQGLARLVKAQPAFCELGLLQGAPLSLSLSLSLCL